MKPKPLILLLFALGCTRQIGGGQPPETPAERRTDMQQPVEAQIERGAQLFATHCAGCHGQSGGGGKGPALVGEGALPVQPPEGRQARRMEFRTVADVFEFVRTTMPPDDPDELSNAQLWAILAFDLRANGIELSSPLDQAQAQKLQLDKP